MMAGQKVLKASAPAPVKALLFLLRQPQRAGSSATLEIVRHTGEQMARGGLARAAAALTDDRQRRSPISAIAFSLGSSDAAHFSRRFRAAYGMPPHLWRQEFDR